MDRLRILVSGRIAADPHHGGATWAVLQYLLGLRALGHQVSFIEPIDAAALQPHRTLAGSINARYFDAVADRFGLAQRDAALLVTGTRETHRRSYDDLLRTAGSSDLLINISGLLRDEALLGPIGRRLYLDVDPAFTQLWHAVEDIDMGLANHTHFATLGALIGEPGSAIPDCGVRWTATRPPVVLSEWPATAGVPRGALTTVANWRSYGSIEHNGVFYGQKAHSLRPYYPLPTLTSQPFLLAIAMHPDEVSDRQALDANRWSTCQPSEVTATPWDYQAFIRGSKAEFGVAKAGYVHSRCGWFSDRSVCYLASGRPVLAQDTGFTSFVPAGEGLLRFDSIDSALEGIEAISTDYGRHAAAARQLAEAYFDSNLVLAQLIDSIGAAGRA
jgi:hypothetical protein